MRLLLKLSVQLPARLVVSAIVQKLATVCEEEGDKYEEDVLQAVPLYKDQQVAIIIAQLKTSCTTQHSLNQHKSTRGPTSKTTIASLLIVLADVGLIVPSHRTAQELWSPNGSIPAGEGGRATHGDG